MIVAFCGHSCYTKNIEDEIKILDILERKIGNTPVEFFLGEYGGFDSLAYDCAKKFKNEHPYANLIHITPYPSIKYPNKDFLNPNERFDSIIYPSLEHIPPRYTISHRNKWIVEQADIIVAYITYKHGGAYTMHRYACRKQKEIYNIAR